MRKCTLSLASRSGAEATSQVGKTRAYQLAARTKDGMVPSLDKALPNSFVGKPIGQATYDKMLERTRIYNDTFGTNSFIEAKLTKDGYVIKPVDNYEDFFDEEVFYYNQQHYSPVNNKSVNESRSQIPIAEYEITDESIDLALRLTSDEVDIAFNRIYSSTERATINEFRTEQGLQKLNDPVADISDTVLFKDRQMKERLAYAEQILGRRIVLSNNPKVKGRVSHTQDGTPVVDINAQIAETDTVFHEVIGHVFINSIGGLKEPRVRALAEKLESEYTEVWAKAKADNPDYTHEELQLEAVAKSVGMAATDIFDSKPLQLSFNRFVVWLAKVAGKIFGLHPAEAYILAKEGLGKDLSNVKGEGVFFQKTGGTKQFSSDMKGSNDPTSSAFVNFNEEEHSYTKGEVLATKSVTEVASDTSSFRKHKEDVTVSDFRAGRVSTAFKVAGRGIAQAHDLELYEAITQPEILKVINAISKTLQDKYDMSAVWGTEAHAVFEDIINGGSTTKYRKEYGPLVKEAIRYREINKQPGMEVITEGRLFHTKTRIAGSVDLIVINHNAGTVDIIDFKTKQSIGGAIEMIDSQKLDGYTKQLSLYAAIIEDTYDVKVSKLIIQPIGMEYNADYTNLEGNSTIQDPIRLDERAAYDKISAKTGAVIGTRMSSTAKLADVVSDLRNRIEETLRASIRDKSKTNTPDRKDASKRQLENFQNNFEIDNVETLITYLSYIKRQIRDVGYMLDNEQSEIFSTDELHSYRNIVESLSILDELRAYVNLNEETLETEGIFEEMQDMIDEIGGAKDRFSAAILTSSSDTLAVIMAGLSNVSRVEKKDKLIIDFQSKNPSRPGSHIYDGKNVTKAEWNKELEAYIFNEIKRNLTNVDKDNVLWWKEYLSSGYVDINTFEGLLSDAISSDSILIQNVNKMFEKADIATRQSVMAARTSFDKTFNELKESTGKSTSEIHEIMVEKDGEGKVTGFLTTKYKSEVFTTLDNYDREIVKHKINDTTDSDEYKKLAEERKEYREKVRNEDGTVKDEYLNPVYAENQEIADVYLALAKNADKHLSGNSTLGRKSWGIKDAIFYKMPSIRQSTLEAAVNNGVFSASKEWFEGNFKRRVDDETEEGVAIVEDELKETGELVNVNMSGTELKEVPILFRAPIPTEELSHDISTMMIENYNMSVNFGNKSDIQPTLELLVDVMKVNRPMVRSGLTGKFKTSKQSPDGRPIRMDTESNEFKALHSMIEHRLYGVNTIKSTGSKQIQALTKYTANVMLSLNVLSSTNNLNVGLVSNFIEASASPHLTLKSLHKGNTLYYRDMANIMDDIGANIPKSKTNQLIHWLNIQGEFEAIGTDYFKDSAAMKVLNSSHTHFLSAVGEHMIMGQLVYGMMEGIKIMNAKGQYLNADGLIVSKENAASINEVISFENGDPSYSVDFYTTSLNPTAKYSSTEISLHIKDMAAKLHGQYDIDQKSKIQRHALGAMAFSMRKWLMRLTKQKYKGITKVATPWDELEIYDKSYSEAGLEYQEGRYASAVRFLIGIGQDLVKQRKLMASDNWNKLNKTQQQNIYKSIVEVGFMVASSLAAGLFYGLHEDEPDDRALLFAAYMSRRLYSELRMFTSMGEMFRIIKTPAVGFNTIDRIGNLALRAWPQFLGGNDLMEVYKSGHRRGTYKIVREAQRLTPIWSQAESITALPEKYKFLVGL